MTHELDYQGKQNGNGEVYGMKAEREMAEYQYKEEIMSKSSKTDHDHEQKHPELCMAPATSSNFSSRESGELSPNITSDLNNL